MGLWATVAAWSLGLYQVSEFKVSWNRDYTFSPFTVVTLGSNSLEPKVFIEVCLFSNPSGYINVQTGICANLSGDKSQECLFTMP